MAKKVACKKIRRVGRRGVQLFADHIVEVKDRGERFDLNNG